MPNWYQLNSKVALTKSVSAGYQIGTSLGYTNLLPSWYQLGKDSKLVGRHPACANAVPSRCNLIPNCLRHEIVSASSSPGKANATTAQHKLYDLRPYSAAIVRCFLTTRQRSMCWRYRRKFLPIFNKFIDTVTVRSD